MSKKRYEERIGDGQRIQVEVIVPQAQQDGYFLVRNEKAAGGRPLQVTALVFELADGSTVRVTAGDPLPSQD